MNPSTIRAAAILLTAQLLIPTLFAAPQTDENEETSFEAARMDSIWTAYADSVENSYTYSTGTIALDNGVATLNIPTGFKFMDMEQTKQVLVDLWENPPSAADGVYGMILPADAGVLDNPFAFIVEYDAMGYVDDEDADDIDYTELLAELQKDNEEANNQRVAEGFGTLVLVGWAEPPHYDKERKVLHWAKELHAQDAESNTLNYNVRVLGRKGVLILNAIADMSELGSVKENIPAVMKMASFNPGHTYEEFDSSIDDVAAWTIGGLVAGKVLAKAGLFALLLKNIKLVIIALSAAGAGIWKFFGGKKKDEPPVA